MVGYADSAGGFGAALKSLGFNATQLGAMLCEGKTLRGRGVGSLDLLENAKMRVDAEAVAASVINIDQAELADVVHSILREELSDRTVSYVDHATHWGRRWAWCVNGSHPGFVDGALGRERATLFPRYFRRMYAEEVETTPLDQFPFVCS